jgi:DNA-binding transcriptional regulator YiaG
MSYLDVLRADPCAYCGGAADTVDHIEPRSGGGPNGWANLTAACRRCNSRKGKRPLLLALLIDPPQRRRAATVWLSAIVGVNLRSYRRRSSLTQRALADALDAPSGLVSTWERGAAMPSDRNQERLATVLGCTVADFFAGADAGSFRTWQSRVAA